MATTDRHTFREELVANHGRCRPRMLPGPLALLGLISTLLATIAAMLFVQEFRPGFASQLVHHPFLLIEVASALLFAPLAAYVALIRSTPGERTPRPAVIGLWVLIALWVAGCAGGFTAWAPESSAVGARPECWLEVLGYGTVFLLLFVGMVERRRIRFSWGGGTLYGLIAGLVPASLMQLACMYDPAHGLHFHYFPMIFLVIAGLALMRYFHR